MSRLLRRFYILLGQGLSRRSKIAILCFLMVTWIHEPVRSQALDGAADAQNDPPDINEAEPGADDDNQPGRIDQLHDQIERGVRGSATWLDSFFEDERYGAELNQTRLRLRFEVFDEVDKSPSFNIKGSLRLRLPNTSRRLMLVIAGSPDDDDDITDTPEDDIRDEFDSTDEENLAVALQYYLKQSVKRNLSATGGVRFRNGGPVAFVGGRFRELVDLGTWDLRFTERLRWFTDNGFESRTTVDLERPVFDDLLFRSTAGASWYENESGLFYDLNFRLFQPLSPTQALEYQVNNQFRTSPNNRLEESSLRLRYRQKIWRDWLAFEVIPQVRFPRSRNFEPTPGALLRFEVSFGG
ncbi:MAG: hypothetical protein AAF530_14535 [Pseudomonadota bacterium]